MVCLLKKNKKTKNNIEGLLKLVKWSTFIRNYFWCKCYWSDFCMACVMFTWTKTWLVILSPQWLWTCFRLDTWELLVTCTCVTNSRLCLLCVTIIQIIFFCLHPFCPPLASLFPFAFPILNHTSTRWLTAHLEARFYSAFTGCVSAGLRLRHWTEKNAVVTQAGQSWCPGITECRWRS